MRRALLALCLLAPASPAFDSWNSRRSSLAPCGDFDGDGCPDLLVASRDAWRPARLWVVSGRDGRRIRGFPGRKTLPGCFSPVAGVGDVDGDGVIDISVGGLLPEPPRQVPWNPQNSWPSPSPAIVSGCTGEVLFQLASLPVLPAHVCTPALVARHLAPSEELLVGSWLIRGEPRGVRVPWGQELLPHPRIRDAIAWMSDLNADGHPDLVLTSAFQRDDRWCLGVYAASGADGSLLWRAIEDENSDGWPSILRDLGDANGDGVHEVLVGLEDRYVSALDGRTGARLWQHNATRHVIWAFASSLDVVGDLDGDGVNDWVCGATESLDSCFDWGECFVGSGLTGERLRQLDYDWLFGFDVSSIGDVDGDGVPDIAIGKERQHHRNTNADSEPSVSVVSGRTWTPIWTRRHVDLRADEGRTPR